MAEDSIKKKRGSSIRFHAVIDRTEDERLAVVLLGDDEKEQIDLPLPFLPENAKSGDHLQITITIDEESRAAAEKRVARLLDRLEKRSDSKGKKDFKL